MKIKHLLKQRYRIDKHAPAFDKALIIFRAPEYLHHEKSLVWFVVAGLIALILVVYGLMSDGWTFSIAVIVFAGAYYSFSRHKPPVVDIKISKMGIKIGGHAFPYNRLKIFWIVYDPPFVNKLYLRTNSALHPDIFVSLENADVCEVRRVLSKHLAELTNKHEPFSDTLVRLFKL